MHHLSFIIIRWPISACFFLFLLLSGTETGAVTGPRRVLIIHSFGREFAPFTAISSGFRTELAQQSPDAIEFHEASLEGALIVEGEREEPVVEYLRVLFAGRPLDLVVAFGDPATQFWLRHRQKLFPATPSLLAAVDQRRLRGLDLGSNVTAVTFSLDLPGAVEHVLKLLPATTNLAVVIGVSPVERYWEREAKSQFQPFTNRVNFTWLNELPLAEMQRSVASLPPRSAVIYGGVSLDAAGVPYEQNRPLTALHTSANAPIFGFFENLIGRGIVGGPLLPIQSISRETARVAVRILAGETPARIQTPPFGPTALVYDWRELKRWDIDETRLPLGSTVRFREPSQWEEHKWQILGAFILCAVESTLIIALLAQLQRRRRAEATLRESEERLNLATSATQVGVWSWDIDQGSIEATAECKRIFGWGPEQSVDFNMFKTRVYPEDRATVQQGLEQAILGRTIYDMQYRILWPNGQTRWISARGRCRYNNSRAVAMVGVLVDITETKVAEQEAAQHRAELAHLTRVNTVGELSGSLAHELNQPLGIILSNAQAAQRLLAQDPPNVAEVRDILADVVAADRRAGNIIQRLRALLKRGDVSFQPQSLNEIIEEVLHLANSDLIGRGVSVVRNLATDLPRVNGDRIQLEQLLLNLIVNAADAMATNPPGTRHLQLKTTLQEGAVRVTVKDEGIGLPQDTEQLFEPFFTTKPHGLGMGLAICRSIAAAHHGRLRAERHPERGALFHLELPFARETKPS